MGRALQLFMVTIMVCSLPALAGSAAPAVADSEPVSVPASTDLDGTSLGSVSPITEFSLNISGRLEPGTAEATASGSGTAGIDIGHSITGDTDRFESALRTAQLDRQLAGAGSDAERRTILRQTASEYGAVIAELRQREVDVARAYLNGEVTERSLLGELGSIHVRAQSLERAIDDLGARADETPGVDLTSELGVYRAELETLQGPVRADAIGMLRGERSSAAIHVATGEWGVTVAMLENDVYIRETVRLDNWAPGEPLQLERLTAAIDRTQELYPWAFAQERGSRSYGEASEAAYIASSEYTEGSITIYLDRSTAEVYREYQRLFVERIETVEVINETQADLRIVVDRTYPGGPVRISLLDTETGSSIDGSVVVDGRHVGSTGGDGVVWTIAPRESMTVAATANGISLTVEYEFQ